MWTNSLYMYIMCFEVLHPSGPEHTMYIQSSISYLHFSSQRPPLLFLSTSTYINWLDLISNPTRSFHFEQNLDTHDRN